MLQTKKNVVLCVVIITMLLIVACSDNTSNDSPDSPTATNNTTTDNAANDAANEDTGPRGKVSVTIYDRGLIPASEGTIEDNRWTKWVNETSPVDVDFVAVPRGEAKQKINTLFASGSAPDIIFEYDPGIKNPLYEQNQLMPLDDMIEQYSTTYKRLVEQTPALKTSGMKSDGKIYEFGKINEAMPQTSMVIRKDWLDKLNLQMPETTEELFEVAKAFASEDPDGNNEDDTYGINIGFGLSEVFGANTGGVTALYKIENGTLVRDWENVRNYIDFAKRLFDNHAIDKDFITDMYGVKARQDFLEGKTGIYVVQANSYGSWSRLWITDYETLKTNAPGAELALLKYPSAPNGSFLPPIANPVQMTAVVNRTAKDPKAVMEYIDFLSEKEVGRTLISGFEGVHWEKGPTGCPIAIDLDKNKTEVEYKSLDMDMVYSVAEAGECLFMASNYNESNPEEKFAKEVFADSMNMFYDMIFEENRQYSGLTHGEHMPTVHKDLLVDKENAVTGVQNILTKAIVSGPSYTVEQAIADAQAEWNKFNGAAIDEFYSDWYAENKDTAFFPEDIYEIVDQQREIRK